MDVYDDTRGWLPIQFLSPTDRAFNLSVVTKPSFARVIARYVFLVYM